MLNGGFLQQDPGEARRGDRLTASTRNDRLVLAVTYPGAERISV